MRKWFRLTNSGRTWEPIEVSARSPLIAWATVEGGEPHEIYDDGQGNLYRYEVVEDE